MRVAALVLAGLAILTPIPAMADAPAPTVELPTNTPVPRPAPGSETPPCNLCTVDPAVLTTLIEGCETQPGSTSCKVLLVLVGAPINTPAQEEQ